MSTATSRADEPQYRRNMETEMVEYEWVVEEIDKHGDIVGVTHWATYAAAKSYAAEPLDNDLEVVRVGLVRDSDRGGYHCRSWAYVTDGKLPEFFADAFDCRICDVPKRFHREVG